MKSVEPPLTASRNVPPRFACAFASAASVSGPRDAADATIPSAAARLAQGRHFDESGFQHRRGHQLRDALAAADLEGFAAEIGEDHLHLAAIVAVDRAGRVETGDAMLERES